jgi:hypothetical protein
LHAGQNTSNGEIFEGGSPPKPPHNVIDCWDEGPFLAVAAAKFASLYDQAGWLCGQHPAGGSRLARLLHGLEFLRIPTGGGAPHLVTAPSPRCMYGFTDMERKQGHVLFTSLVTVQAGSALAAAVGAAATAGVSGCMEPGAAEPFALLAALVNDSIAAGALDDTRFGSGLLLATDMAGYNAQPDVWGSGLAVAVGAGTDAQRAKISASLAVNASTFFRWGQARHLPLPLCWEAAAALPGNASNPNICTTTGEGGWCGGQPCGSYQNGGYWATPLGWLLPAVADHDPGLASELLADVLADFRAHGINEAVNHDFHYNPEPASGPKTYTGASGYLASAASVYSAIWEPVPKAQAKVLAD